MVISLGWLSPATSSGLPTARTTRAGSRCLLGLAPTGGYRAAPVTRRAVGSYPTVSPLPLNLQGGLFSVALSVALRRPGVTWQSARWSSDFPRRAMLPAHRDHRAPPHPRPEASSAAAGPASDGRLPPQAADEARQTVWREGAVGGAGAARRPGGRRDPEPAVRREDDASQPGPRG